jgi:pantoate--beta-alanine ligase
VHTLPTPEAMTAWSAARSGTIGFVPTMGYLHDGHAALMRRLRPMVDHLVVSVYVNPLQFGPDEDLDRYPRDPEGDAALCEAQGVDALFMPPDLYPDGFATQVSVLGLTDYLCGAGRPGHFEGVATVCARLFGLVRCTHAAFGEKDFQQLMVLRRMVTDLALPVQIVPVPVQRADDGLALSSRNAYLDAEQRRRAPTLQRALRSLAEAVEAGERDVGVLQRRALAVIDSDGVEYLEVVDAQTLIPIERVGERPARALVAARYGATRLIDNVAVGTPLRWT